MQNSRCAVILAASDGKQMKSSRPAAMAEVLFQPMIDWVLDAVQNAGIQSTCTVAAHCEALASHLEGRGETILLGPSGHRPCDLAGTRLFGAFRGGDVFLLNGKHPPDRCRYDTIRL